MSKPNNGSIVEHFAGLEDPRVDRTKDHELLDIIFIAVCAVICGADGWVGIEAFGHAKEKWLKQFLALSNGIPSHDTFGRVFARLDAEQFQACFLTWIQAVSQITEGQVIAIDGKTLRRSHDKFLGKAAIEMVSAWASADHLVLGQVAVDAESNEITAIPELLRVLEVTGCIVTIDAIGCQTDIAQAIVDKGGDYVLALKANQGQLVEDVQSLFEIEFAERTPFHWVEHDYHRAVDKGHGRVEILECWVVTDPEYLDYIRAHKEWPELRSVILVRGERRVGDQVSRQDRYYVSSLEGDAAGCLHAVRGHWGIENCVHWVLDLAFREDDSRVRKENGPHNFAILRHIALNLLKQEKTAKVGTYNKRLKAGWDEAYLLKVLFG
jgi:predicted transposase YbfD/YdcC